MTADIPALVERLTEWRARAEKAEARVATLEAALQRVQFLLEHEGKSLEERAEKAANVIRAALAPKEPNTP